MPRTRAALVLAAIAAVGCVDLTPPDVVRTCPTDDCTMVLASGGPDGGGGLDAPAPQRLEAGSERLSLGSPCAAAEDCASGVCTGGACCDRACAGPCSACDLPGSVGRCAPRPTGSVCAPATCSGSTYTQARTCDGMGECAPEMASSCSGFACGPNGTCLTRCTSAADCVAPAMCTNGSCSKIKPLGAPCAAPGECASALCQQGVCCATACSGTCKSCALPGSLGTCTNVPSGADPLNQCAETPVATCGGDGTCDGSGGCRKWGQGSVCGAGSCAGGVLAMARTCGGSGTCQPAPPPATCYPYACVGDSCRKRCKDASECVAGATCAGGDCKLANGLKAEYFADIALKTLKLVRVDATVDFDWAQKAPDPLLPVDGFGVRWTGKLTPRYSETYTFIDVSDDGARLWLNGQIVIDAWTDNNSERMGTVALTANQPYDFKLEYYDRSSAAYAHLSWTSPSQPREIVPTTALTPAP